MTDHKALIAEARQLEKAYGKSHGMLSVMSRLADALESASVERAVVEAQALEQAVEFLATTPAVTIAGKGGAAELLRARAVEIREGRQ
jgi:hypothetical protein